MYLLGITLSIEIIDRGYFSKYMGCMPAQIVTIKIDPKMKAALKKLADEQFISVSAAIKQAIHKHLEDNGIDWRNPDQDKSK